MSVSLRVFGLGILAATLLVGVGVSQEGKKDSKPFLPPGLKNVKLSKDQEDKIRNILSDYKNKIDDLKGKIVDLENNRKRDWMKILTEEQKKLYLGEEATPTKGKKDSKSDK